MARGFGGGGNMNSMMRQMQKVQQKMEEAQQRIDETVMQASAGGGVVQVEINGKKEVLQVKINPEIVDLEDVEMLEDMVLVAVNDAIQQAVKLQETEMGKVTGGISLPGM